MQQEQQALEIQLQLAARRLQQQERDALLDAAVASGLEVARVGMFSFYLPLHFGRILLTI